MRIKIYEPKAWLHFLFNFHHENIFRRLRPIVILMIIYAGLVSITEYCLHDYYTIINDLSSLGQFHLLFNFVLSIMIAFRVNTAYARWWEGRSLWGQLTNSSRNLAMRIEAILGLNAYPQFKQYLIKFPELLKLHLRNEGEQCGIIMTELGFTYHEQGNLPSLLIRKMTKELTLWRQEQKINLEQYLVLMENVGVYTDVLGGCEKIKNTPVPLPFNVLIKHALLFYMLIFPFGWVGTFGFFVIPMIIVMIYVLWGLEALADELEDPFNYDDNDLPLDAICTTIARDVDNISN